MNIFKKKIGKKDSGDEWKTSGSFVRKPVKGWIHPDHHLETSGVIYECRVSNHILSCFILSFVN